MTWPEPLYSHQYYSGPLSAYDARRSRVFLMAAWQHKIWPSCFARDLTAAQGREGPLFCVWELCNTSGFRDEQYCADSGRLFTWSTYRQPRPPWCLVSCSVDYLQPSVSTLYASSTRVSAASIGSGTVFILFFMTACLDMWGK